MRFDAILASAIAKTAVRFKSTFPNAERMNSARLGENVEVPDGIAHLPTAIHASAVTLRLE
jgi:hypothetical protein